MTHSLTDLQEMLVHLRMQKIQKQRKKEKIYWKRWSFTDWQVAGKGGALLAAAEVTAMTMDGK